MFLELNLAGLIDTQWAVILPAMFFPFGVYLSYVYYGSSLPRELVDAARVDGASELRVFWNLALPLARPLLGLLAFISFNANWNNFFGPYVFLNNDKLYNLPVGLNSIVAATSALRPGFNPTPGAPAFVQADAAMAAMFTIVPVVIVFIFSMRYVTSGAFTGGVKG
jgi:multiple sugar transport system permease protein